MRPKLIMAQSARYEISILPYYEIIILE